MTSGGCISCAFVPSATKPSCCGGRPRCMPVACRRRVLSAVMLREVMVTAVLRALTPPDHQRCLADGCEDAVGSSAASRTFGPTTVL